MCTSSNVQLGNSTGCDSFVIGDGVRDTGAAYAWEVCARGIVPVDANDGDKVASVLFPVLAASLQREQGGDRDHKKSMQDATEGGGVGGLEDDVMGRGKLDYRDNQMGPAGITALFENLFLAEIAPGKRHVCLSVLLLSNNVLGERGALTLGKALRCLPCLAVLDLANTQLEDAGAEALVKGLGGAHFHRHNHADACLVKLHRRGGGQGGQDVLPQLRELVLRSNSLGKRAAAALCRLLRRRLLLLDLKDNNLCDEAIAIISEQLIMAQEEAEAAVLEGARADGGDECGVWSGLRVLDVAGNPLESGGGGEHRLHDMARRLHGLISLNGCCLPTSLSVSKTGAGVQGAAGRDVRRVVLDGKFTAHVRSELVVLARALRHAVGRRGRKEGESTAGTVAQQPIQVLSLRDCNLLRCGDELVELLKEVVDACKSGCVGGGGLEELDVRGNGLSADVAKVMSERTVAQRLKYCTHPLRIHCSARFARASASSCIPLSHPIPYIADIAGFPLLRAMHFIANAFAVHMLRCGIQALFALAHAETSLAVINGVYLRGSCLAVSKSRAQTADDASPAWPGSRRRWRRALMLRLPCAVSGQGDVSHYLFLHRTVSRWRCP